MQTTVLTATFSPGQDLEGLAEQPAHPACAATLSDAVGKSSPITFQINRCHLDAPAQEELIFTQSGRAFIKNCRLRDRTGGVDVDVVRSAVLFLYGCADEEELKAHLAAQSLTSVKVRINVRGVLREESGVTRRYIVKVGVTPLNAIVSLRAMRLAVGLSNVSNDGVLAAPADRMLAGGYAWSGTPAGFW